jgi:hypothetical protein
LGASCSTTPDGFITRRKTLHPKANELTASCPMKVILHSQVHEYRVRDDDGTVNIIRAQWDARTWNFTVTTKKDPEWHEVETPTLELMEGLREVLFNKYQRGRLPWHFVVDIDKVIAQMKADQPG